MHLTPVIKKYRRLAVAIKQKLEGWKDNGLEMLETPTSVTRHPYYAYTVIISHADGPDSQDSIYINPW